MPTMQGYDVVVVLGAQIIRNQHGRIIPAFHTEMRARAAGIAYKLGLTMIVIISGGHNVGVRYSFKDNSVFPKPNLNLFALIRARLYPSEASVMAEFIRKAYAVPRSAMNLEERSTDTKANAENCRIVVERLHARRVAILTHLYHMERAMDDFKEVRLNPDPLYAEDLLVLDDHSWIDRIVEYYSNPRGGRQWDTATIRKNLENRESIAKGLVQI